jgi:hypothetical protein
MTDAFIVHQPESGNAEILEMTPPVAMTDVWFATPESPLNERAKALSADGVTLAGMRWEADVLKLWAFKHGQLEFEYDSSPSFATCTITPPVTSLEGDLAALFGKPDASAAVKRLLARKKGLGFISESQRLAQLLELLGVARTEART